MFWLGRGGSVEHTISGLDIALWDLWGKALGQPVSRLLGRQLSRPDQALRVDPVRRSAAAASKSCSEQVARGFRAIKMGWRPFGRVSRKLDELLIKTARETVGDDVELMVDAGGSEQFWPHGVDLGPRDGAACWATTASSGSKRRCVPDDVEGFTRAARRRRRC